MNPLRPNFHKKGTRYYSTVNDLYLDRINQLTAFASRHVYQSDLALDMVHDALSRTLAYVEKHPDRKISEQVVQFQILKACKRANRFSREYTSGDTRYLRDEQGEK